MKERDVPWFREVRAGLRVTSFSSPAEAMAFLAKGIDNVPEEMQQTFAALQFRYENAND